MLGRSGLETGDDEGDIEPLRCGLDPGAGATVLVPGLGLITAPSRCRRPGNRMASSEPLSSLKVGPQVRIRLPPAGSLVRTSLPRSGAKAVRTLEPRLLLLPPLRGLR